MTRRYRLHKAIFFKVDNWPYWASSPVIWVSCKILGHVPIADQCGNPDHDFCAYCMKSTPGKATS